MEHFCLVYLTLCSVFISILGDYCPYKAMFTDLPRALLQLNKLQHLTIADTQITNWDTDIVRHIGSTLQTLILINTSLTSWPTWVTLLPHLGTLELSYMQLRVPDDAFDNQINTMFSVNFENCNLTEIPSALSKLIHLQYLVLDNNNITKVTGLPNSPNLTTLTLDGNQISDAAQLSEGLRPVANSLTTLTLRENRLLSMPDLSAMVKLDSLDLTQNVISSIGNGKVPASLTVMDLENNYLPSLYFFMQTGVKLMILRFDHNSVLDIRDVDIPVSVSDMSVASNRIKQLTDASFPLNSQMGSLTLDFNPISKISLHAFSNLQSLVYMSMVGTQLTRLPLALGALASLRTVSFDQSAHLVCTCVEKDLQDWTSNVEINGDCGMTSVAYFFQFMSDQCPD
ncbi:unnamed protein product [Candidula unifasciata]|uniref:Toll-like receptor 15 n=1 Tax=Candidula unifasciata TaxID=100452 RepID=A0A8S3ZZ20_9EUPU|nr:unnamed protein product [Candidula unifasciata]